PSLSAITDFHHFLGYKCIRMDSLPGALRRRQARCRRRAPPTTDEEALPLSCLTAPARMRNALAMIALLAAMPAAGAQGLGSAGTVDTIVGAPIDEETTRAVAEA